MLDTIQRGGSRRRQWSRRRWTWRPGVVDSVRLRTARLCAEEIDGSRRRSMRSYARDDRLRLAAIHSTIPEYNDEQRLRAGTRDELGPLAGIFASPHLGSFTAEWQFHAHGQEGVLVAHVVVDTISGETIPPTYQQLG